MHGETKCDKSLRAANEFLNKYPEIANYYFNLGADMNLKEENVKPGCRFIKRSDNTMVTVDSVADFEKKYTKKPVGIVVFHQTGKWGERRCMAIPMREFVTQFQMEVVNDDIDQLPD